MTVTQKALFVHLFTASGAVFAMLAMLAATEAEWSLMFSWLVVAFAVWFVLTSLAAGILAPLGLMIPMIIIGGCLGRLYALLLDRSGLLVDFRGLW